MRFVRWLEAVGNKVGMKKDVKVELSGNKIVIDGYEYEFDNVLEKIVAEKLFGEVKVVKKKRKVVKDEAEN